MDQTCAILNLLSPVFSCGLRADAAGLACEAGLYIIRYGVLQLLSVMHGKGALPATPSTQ